MEKDLLKALLRDLKQMKGICIILAIWFVTMSACVYVALHFIRKFW